MRTAILCVALAACGNKTDSKKTDTQSSGGSASSAKSVDSGRFGKVKQPKVSAICDKARLSFGYGAECIETELPDVTTAAGKVTRLVQKGDASGAWTYALTHPDGKIDIMDGPDTVDEILKGVDAKTVAPETLAKLYVTLHEQVAVVRCLPGANDTLPKSKDGKDLACKPPAIAKAGDKLVLTFIQEQFPTVRLNGRDSHWLWETKVVVGDHTLRSSEGTGLAELPKDAPLPAGSPPPPTMSTPPAWVAKPVDAPADITAALCKLAAEKVSGMEGRGCKAYAYPSLDTPYGSLFYLANEIGRRHLLGMKKADGTFVVGYDLETDQNPMIPIVKNYDPKVLPADKVVALHLFLHAEAAHILCLPGSNDVIPDATCEPPKAEKKGDNLVLTYIVEELPFPDNHGSVADPSVRSYQTELTPGGGSEGGGFRLVDMREGEN